jgi:glycosyltransferase involved in cell wall biosynthesis
MHPLVSILIPAYNSEKWIKTTIQSALNQTYKNKEIIIVDDGSTDNTLSIAKQFESNSVKVITQKNQGASAARNKALSFSQGDFIQWLDSDDILAPDKIEIHLTRNSQSPSSRVLYSSAFGLFYYRLKKAKIISNSLWQNLSPKSWIIEHFKHFTEGYWMYPAAWFVSRKLTELAGAWDERLSLNDDGEYFCRVVAASELVEFHEQALSFYRLGSIFSLSNMRTEKHLVSLNLANNLCVDHLLKIENSDETRKACRTFLQTFVAGIPADKSYIAKDTKNRIIELGGFIPPPSETRKFIFIRKILGYRIAQLIKRWLWNKQRLVQMEWDKFMAFIFRDGV